MKKRIYRVLAAIMATTLMIGTMTLVADAGSKKRYTYTAPTASITEQEALNIAYADAGVTEATLVKSKLEYDDGYLEYDFTFCAGGYKYEYEIDATNGRVLEREKKRDKNYVQPVQPTQPVQPAAGITADEALNIALTDAGFAASDVRVKENKFKNSKKKGAYYEVEFYAGWLEYEYDIDATTGAILKKEIDD